MKKLSTFDLFYRPDNKKALDWAAKIQRWIGKKYSSLKIDKTNPGLLIVLGGDGTILEAARKYQRSNPIILGLNLGHVGFSASSREPKKFFPALDQFLKGNYLVAKRMMMAAVVFRNNKQIFAANALNDAVIQSPLGIVDLEVSIADHPVQYIHGTGVLVSTAAGSTAYNLSAHGPIVMPDIKCMIVTELMDHNIPTPSIVVKRNREIRIKIIGFRKRGLLSITKTGEKADVLIVSDGEKIFPLEYGDVIKIKRSPGLIKFAELEKNYFFKSLQEKFSFK